MKVGMKGGFETYTPKTTAVVLSVTSGPGRMVGLGQEAERTLIVSPLHKGLARVLLLVTEHMQKSVPSALAKQPAPVAPSTPVQFCPPVNEPKKRSYLHQMLTIDERSVS